jgi:competence protein ComEC
MYMGLVILLFRLEIFGPLLELLINFTNLGLSWIAGLPWASLSGIWISQMELFLLSVALVSGCLALLGYKKKLLYLSMTSVLLMSLSFSYHFYQTHRQSKIIFYSLRNNTAIAFIHHDQAWLLTSLAEKSEAFRSLVSPALEQSGVRRVTYLNIHQPFTSGNLQLQEHQVLFSNFSLLLADTCFNGKTPYRELSYDVINLGEHTKLDLNALLKHCKTKQLIIDGNNSSYGAERFETVAENYDLPVYNLRIKKAYLVNLTK